MWLYIVIFKIRKKRRVKRNLPLKNSNIRRSFEVSSINVGRSFPRSRSEHRRGREGFKSHAVRTHGDGREGDHRRFLWRLYASYLQLSKFFYFQICRSIDRNHNLALSCSCIS